MWCSAIEWISSLFSLLLPQRKRRTKRWKRWQESTPVNRSNYGIKHFLNGNAHASLFRYLWHSHLSFNECNDRVNWWENGGNCFKVPLNLLWRVGRKSVLSKLTAKSFDSIITLSSSSSDHFRLCETWNSIILERMRIVTIVSHFPKS